MVHNGINIKLGEGHMKNRKRIIYICILIFALVLFIFLYKKFFLNKTIIFLKDYIDYINLDIAHRAKLFEGIISGICAGSVTFVALFISISHENKKNKMFWERERKKEREDRLLSIRPFLNIGVRNVSSARTGLISDIQDVVIVGEANNYQYASVFLSNDGYGKCIDIQLDGHKCSVSQLDVGDKQELKIYFQGIQDEESEFQIYFGYKDIFGNAYLQCFTCKILSGSKELITEIGESLLNGGEE